MAEQKNNYAEAGGSIAALKAQPKHLGAVAYAAKDRTSSTKPSISTSRRAAHPNEAIVYNDPACYTPQASTSPFPSWEQSN